MVLSFEEKMLVVYHEVPGCFTVDDRLVFDTNIGNRCDHKIPLGKMLSPIEYLHKFKTSYPRDFICVKAILLFILYNRRVAQLVQSTRPGTERS